MFEGVRKIFVHPDGRPMLFYLPPVLCNIDQDRIIDLVAKGGGAFVSQPGPVPEVFTLLNAEAGNADLPEGASALDIRFVECSSERGCAYDWRQFLIGLPEQPEVRSIAAFGSPSPFASTQYKRDDGHAPAPSEVPAPLALKGPLATRFAKGDFTQVRPKGDMSCLADPAKHWGMTGVAQPHVCDTAGGGYRAKRTKGSASDEDTTASDEDDIKANTDYKDFGDGGAMDFEQRPSQHSGSIESGGPAPRHSKMSNGSLSRRNSKEAIELLAGMVEARRQEITKKDEHHHSTLHKLAHAAEWFGAGAFFLSSSVILFFWARHEYEEAFVTTFFVTSIASAAYLTKATIGDFIINGTKVPVARYLDWIVTTPLMLYELCHLGHAPVHTTMFVIGCDILMLGFGIISALISWKRIWLKHVWFFFSSAFYILMLICLQVDVAQGSALDQPETVQALFKRLQVLTAVTWSFYPIVVLLGRAHFKVITRDMEDILLMMLDVAAKIGMEGFIVATCATGGCKADSYGDDGH